MSLMHEVEDSHLSQPYAKHMWKLQALGSLSVLLNAVFGCPLRGMSFSCSPPAVLRAEPVACQSVGGRSQSGVGAFTELRAVVGSEPSGASPAPLWGLSEGGREQEQAFCQVHGSFSTSIVGKQWWEEVGALSCGEIGARRL